MEFLPPTYIPGFHDINVVKKMKYNDFGGTNLKVSQISLGTAGFSSIYGYYTLEDCKATVHKAIKAGINYIDTSPWYGNGTSEEILGKCLEGIPRAAYYLATKPARPGRVHDIEFAESLDIIIEETLPVLEETLKNGKAKFIGITGYHISALNECINMSKTKIDAMLSYSRMSLLDNTLAQYLPNFKSKNLAIINAAGNCMGLLVNDGPQQWHPASSEIKDICMEAQEICKKQNVELAKLALYYCLQQKGAHTILVGMNNVGLLESNLDVLYNGLNKKEHEILKHLRFSIFSKLSKGHWENENEEIKRSLLKEKGKVFL